jgi:hypothetical protein
MTQVRIQLEQMLLAQLEALFLPQSKLVVAHAQPRVQLAL